MTMDLNHEHNHDLDYPGMVTVDQVHELALQYPLKTEGLHPIDNALEILCRPLFTLLRQGKLIEFQNRIDAIFPRVLIPCLNYQLYDEYYGTVLHCLLYWNNSPNAFQLYTYLRELGAIPKPDYYMDYPWENSGNYYNITFNLIKQRNLDDFTDIIERVRDYENDEDI